jgi:hypothetical protein
MNVQLKIVSIDVDATGLEAEDVRSLISKAVSGTLGSLAGLVVTGQPVPAAEPEAPATDAASPETPVQAAPRVARAPKAPRTPPPPPRAKAGSSPRPSTGGMSPTRQAVLAALTKTPKRMAELVAETRMKDFNLLYHLDGLRKAGLVTSAGSRAQRTYTLA